MCVCDSVHQEVGSALDQKQKDLFDVSELGGVLSQAGAARLVEPSLLRLNRRWEEVELKFAPFRRQIVSVPVIVPQHITCHRASTLNHSIVPLH